MPTNLHKAVEPEPGNHRRGFLAIPRYVIDSEMFAALSPAAAKVLIWCLHQTNWKESQIEWDGGTKTLQPGQLVVSERGIAERLNLTRQQVRCAFRSFEKWDFATRKGTHNGPHKATILSIVNWDRYRREIEARNPQWNPQWNPQGTHKDPYPKQVNDGNGKETTTSADVVVVDSLTQELVEVGISEERAVSLVKKFPSERIRRQLGWLSKRTCKDRAATLITAIEEDWTEPQSQTNFGFEDHLSARPIEEIARKAGLPVGDEEPEEKKYPSGVDFKLTVDPVLRGILNEVDLATGEIRKRVHQRTMKTVSEEKYQEMVEHFTADKEAKVASIGAA